MTLPINYLLHDDSIHSLLIAVTRDLLSRGALEDSRSTWQVTNSLEVLVS